MSKALVNGFHHITAMTSDAQKNIDFYAGILGLRMIKKTINFDAPDIYHLYFANEQGLPGTVITFFPFKNLQQGRKGNGQVGVTGYSVPKDSLEYWTKRLSHFEVDFQKPAERFNGEKFIYFEDFDGLGLELIEAKDDSRPLYADGPVPEKYSIIGFHSATFFVNNAASTKNLLVNLMNYEPKEKEGNRERLKPAGKSYGYVDLLEQGQSFRALNGSGTVHHIAFSTPDTGTQEEVRRKIIAENYNVTPILDRQYFKSIYFREQNGILFEIATAGPGFDIDEPMESLGEKLMLPPWEEKNRKTIEQNLEPVKFDKQKFKID
ncbi:MAG: ring-cleaving dioxygenase [Chitinophagaceae bacterium]|nr:MAG: ring-cleaving dioxygenase [Chitinophagaceae bacterium]